MYLIFDVQGSWIFISLKQIKLYFFWHTIRFYIEIIIFIDAFLLGDVWNLINTYRIDRQLKKSRIGKVLKSKKKNK